MQIHYLTRYLSIVYGVLASLRIVSDVQVKTMLLHLGLVVNVVPFCVQVIILNRKNKVIWLLPRFNLPLNLNWIRSQYIWLIRLKGYVSFDHIARLEEERINC
jgi:hypothetical protein